MYEQIARNKRRTAACVLLFFGVWVGIGALVGFLWAEVSRAPSGPSPGVGGDMTVGLAVAGAFALLGIAYPEQYRQLHDLVEALALGEGFAKPDVYVIDDPSPNAFATGMSPRHAAITVTTGLLSIMDREELEGVLSHEMSHIKNYDVRLLLIVSTLIGLAGLLASLVWRSVFFMRGRGRQAGQFMVIVFGAGALLAVVACIFGPLVRLALSRRRESLADVSGVELTRNPVGLVSALKKLQANDKPFVKFNHATAAMCIDDPLQHHEGRFHHLFDTHPPIAERIAALEQLSYARAA